LVLSGLVASTGRCSPISPAFPYTTALPIFQPYQIRKPAIRRYLKRKRSRRRRRIRPSGARSLPSALWVSLTLDHSFVPGGAVARSEEHTSELQSRENLVCRLLLEKKNEEIR